MKKNNVWLNAIIILGPALVLVAVAWFLSFRQIPLYRTTTSLLVIHTQAATYDPSSLQRSAEQVAGNLAKVIPSESFLREVLNAGFGLEGMLGGNLSERLRLWREAMTVVVDGPILNLTFWSTDKESGSRLASAASFVLTTKSALWHGAGETISVRMIDPPLTGPEPVQPNLLVNIGGAGLVGLILGGFMLYYRRVWQTSEQESRPS